MKTILDYVPGTEYKIFQRRDLFSFGTDALLLSAYFKPRGNTLDLGTGNGIIPLRLVNNSKITKIVGYEVQDEVYSLARDSVEFNELQDRIVLHHGDIKNVISDYGRSNFNTVITNPPYFKSSLKNNSENKTLSRHGDNIENWIEIAASALVPEGYFYTMNRPENLTDVIYYMRNYGVEPKQLCFVKNKVAKEPYLFLIGGRKNGKPGLVVDMDLILFDSQGKTEEFTRLYKMEI